MIVCVPYPVALQLWGLFAEMKKAHPHLAEGIEEAHVKE